MHIGNEGNLACAVTMKKQQNNTMTVFQEFYFCLWKIQNGWLWYEWLPYMKTSSLQEPVWIYCPGQAGVSDKEKLDRLASTVSITETLKIGRADIPHAIRDNWMRSDKTTEEIAQ